MSSDPAPQPTAAVEEGSKDVTAPHETDAKPAAHHAGLDAALVKTLDHFRTSFMSHMYDIVAPLYEHHAGAKPGEHHPEAHHHLPSHIKKHDVPEERRIHPFVDMWETKSEYGAEIELAGLENKDAITIQWTTPRTVFIEVTVPRSTPGGEHAEAEGAKTEPDEKTDEKKDEKGVAWLLRERRVGKVVRILMFPGDVEMKAMHAHLAAGLLTIKVPKRFSTFEGWKVSVS
jgi:HSP20 family molecular chaperone IbpA